MHAMGRSDLSGMVCTSTAPTLYGDVLTAWNLLFKCVNTSADANNCFETMKHSSHCHLTSCLGTNLLLKLSTPRHDLINSYLRVQDHLGQTVCNPFLSIMIPKYLITSLLNSHVLKWGSACCNFANILPRVSMYSNSVFPVTKMS